MAPLGGVVRPGREDALRAIDSPAWPRSWRAFGPRPPRAAPPSRRGGHSGCAVAASRFTWCGSMRPGRQHTVRCTHRLSGCGSSRRASGELLSGAVGPVLPPMPPISAVGRASLCTDIGETEAMTGRGSFEQFYTGAVNRLLGQLFLVTGNLHEAEEVVQDALARASVRWSWLRDYNAPEAW